MLWCIRRSISFLNRWTLIVSHVQCESRLFFLRERTHKHMIICQPKCHFSTQKGFIKIRQRVMHVRWLLYSHLYAGRLCTSPIRGFSTLIVPRYLRTSTLPAILLFNATWDLKIVFIWFPVTTQEIVWKHKMKLWRGHCLLYCETCFCRRLSAQTCLNTLIYIHSESLKRTAIYQLILLKIHFHAESLSRTTLPVATLHYLFQNRLVSQLVYQIMDTSFCL